MRLAGALRPPGVVVAALSPAGWRTTLSVGRADSDLGACTGA